MVKLAKLPNVPIYSRVAWAEAVRISEIVGP